MSGAQQVAILIEVNGLEYSGRKHTHHGRHEEAEASFLEAFALRQNLESCPPGTTAQTLQYLARVCADSGDTSTAEALHGEALALAEGPESDKHGLKICLTNFAVFYREQHRFTEAEAFIQRLLALPGKMLGSEEAEHAQKMTQLGRLRQEEGRLDEAERIFQEALQTAENAFGMDHPSLGFFLSPYALFLRRTGREEEAHRQEKRKQHIKEKYLREYQPKPGQCPPVIYPKY